MAHRLPTVLTVLAFLALGLMSCERNDVVAPGHVDNTEVYAGGATTVFISGSTAFSTPATNLTGESLVMHADGDKQFEQSFVTAPAPVNSGLGPLFNNTSCESCHQADGRGRPPGAGEELASMLIRISFAGNGPHGGPLSVPLFGTQLQQRAVLGKVSEGSVIIQWSDVSGTYDDGTAFQLRRPTFTVTGRVPSGILTSARIAPPVFGLGLLEAVDEETILALADENDANGDGISGKPNYVWDVQSQQMRLGRFGWKANAPTLLQQCAGAYNEDMGITSPYFPLENCYGTSECDTLTDDPEVTDQILANVTFYVQTLGVPARRDFDKGAVVRGKQLFIATGCTSCHLNKLHTGPHPAIPEVSGQTIFPYTDLLLHDMGPDLADNRPDFRASGSEWRTAPLWGIGLTQVVNGHTFFLHDGRARSLEEAILWHGGEAEGAQSRFRQLTAADREALLTFLRSL